MEEEIDTQLHSLVRYHRHFVCNIDADSSQIHCLWTEATECDIIAAFIRWRVRTASLMSVIASVEYTLLEIW